MFLKKIHLMIMQLHREYDDNIRRHLSDIYWNLEEK